MANPGPVQLRKLFQSVQESSAHTRVRDYTGSGPQSRRVCAVFRLDDGVRSPHGARVLSVESSLWAGGRGRQQPAGSE